jgi:hypothetical protein
MRHSRAKILSRFQRDAAAKLVETARKRFGAAYSQTEFKYATQDFDIPGESDSPRRVCSLIVLMRRARYSLL